MYVELVYYTDHHIKIEHDLGYPNIMVEFPKKTED